MLHNLSDTDSLLNAYVAELRHHKRQRNPRLFRQNLHRIGQIMAYEASKVMRFKKKSVETPLGVAEMRLPKEKIVVASILRAGLPLHDGVLDSFDKAENAFVSAYRKHHKNGTFDIRVEYLSCPDLTGKTLILCDPMLATGMSMHLALEALQVYGEPADIHAFTVIASTDGLDFFREQHPDVTLWAAAIDEELTAKAYIVPGLGDAGDLAYGPKVQG